MLHLPTYVCHLWDSDGEQTWADRHLIQNLLFSGKKRYIEFRLNCNKLLCFDDIRLKNTSLYYADITREREREVASIFHSTILYLHKSTQRAVYCDLGWAKLEMTILRSDSTLRCLVKPDVNCSVLYSSWEKYINIQRLCKITRY